jgi:hypothetical protein
VNGNGDILAQYTVNSTAESRVHDLLRRVSVDMIKRKVDGNAVTDGPSTRRVAHRDNGASRIGAGHNVGGEAVVDITGLTYRLSQDR